MRCTLVGSRYFGAAVLDKLRADGVDVVRVVAPAADDRLAQAAQAAGVPLSILASPRLVPGSDLHEDCDLVIAAVEWTLLEGDPIAGGSIYHLADGWDAGAIAAQDWCFVVRGETARDLWERALAPMGLKLISQVVAYAAEHGEVPAFAQDPRFATKAPMLKRTVSLTEEKPPATTSLVVTAIGADRPGIVRLLSDRAQGFAANWAGSRMASLAGQFAGMVHFQVAPERADALTNALRGLESSGLQLHIARSDAPPMPAGRRMVKLELVGPDRPGIIQQLSSSLSERGVSIEDLHTEIVSSATPEQHLFKVKALLVVPQSLPNDALRRMLETLASEMMLDIGLGEHG
jgi:glycine cleavage system regulatory protein